MNTPPQTFRKAQRWVKPLVEEFNQSVICLEDSVQEVKLGDGLEGGKTGKVLNIRATETIKFAIGRLITPLFRGLTGVPAYEMIESNSEWRRLEENRVFVRADSFTGYLFPGQLVRLLRFPNDDWYYAMQDGLQIVNAMIYEDLETDGVVRAIPTDWVDVDDEFEREFDLFERYGPTVLNQDVNGDPVPKQIFCGWNDILLRWEAINEACEVEAEEP